ncbi:MAG: PEP-CTERM sorting domain-containing protein [Planctomycetales bacterium]|nr:PEP-CTERM sorting domain-containing protein [Planctomycetales bacterium]
MFFKKYWRNAMKATATVFGVVAMVLALASAATANVIPFSENFEAGYNAASLDGQNGWATVAWAGTSMDVGSTAGKGPSWGATTLGNAGWIANSKSHGSTFGAGDHLILSADYYAAVGARGLVDVEKPGGSFGQYIMMEVLNDCGGDTGIRMEVQGSGGYAATADWTAAVTAQWYHLQLDWTVGDDAVYTVWDASNAQVFQGTVNTSTLITSADAAAMSVVAIGAAGAAGSAAAIDNISLVPEPSSVVLLAIGLLGLLCYAWRKRK